MGREKPYKNSGHTDPRQGHGVRWIFSSQLTARRGQADRQGSDCFIR
ncbi:hypothetical protein GCWU000246_00616 [Jonquetella anthropi E3_33 E1]|nr:hypothetical protein GCWU000246_00616 [Jonquetella anthropi E3_33 E1]